MRYSSKMSMKSFVLQKKAFKLLGQQFNTNRNTIILNVIIVFNLAAKVLIITGTFVYCIENIKDIRRLTDALSPAFTGVLTIIKGITFVVNKVLFIKVITGIEQMIRTCTILIYENITKIIFKLI